jgi:hypothetical protein
MHPIVKLAKAAIELYVTKKRVYKPATSELADEMAEQAGVFVSVKKNGELRGCIGTFTPQKDSVALEIVSNAISAVTRDPRFPPVTIEELNSLNYSVDILTPPEPIDNIDQLDPRRYGVIVKSGYKQGLLLPDLKGVDTPEEQVVIAKMKAKIAHDEPVQLYRFEVRRYRE